MEDFQSIGIDQWLTSLLAEMKPPGGFWLLESLKLAVVMMDVSINRRISDSNSMEMISGQPPSIS